jgi:hypothetical protein
MRAVDTHRDFEEEGISLMDRGIREKHCKFCFFLIGGFP